MNVAHSLPLPTARADHGRSHIAIWLALAIALLLHFIFILVPLIKQAAPARPETTNIEIQVTRYTTEPAPTVPPATLPDAQLDAQPDVPSANSPNEPTTQQLEAPVQLPVETPLSQAVEEAPAKPVIVQESSEQRLQRLSPGILSSQFIREDSAADKIFGPALQQDLKPEQKEFHFPQQANMITMLDRPVADLPFEFTPGLIEFAYDPGVQGDIQRFWDKITPEFGWRTNYGTQVKCKWILVIAACGWGRSGDSISAKATILKPDQLE